MNLNQELVNYYIYQDRESFRVQFGFGQPKQKRPTIVLSYKEQQATSNLPQKSKPLKLIIHGASKKSEID